MKRVFLAACVTGLYIAVAAQQKEFEGVAVFKIDFKSKTVGVGDNAWKAYAGLGDSMIVYEKQGNSRQISGSSEFYSITKDQRVYMKFKGIDTLYYMEYASDTTSVSGITRSEEKKTIAGLECKTITIKSPGGSRKYYYAPSIYVNPEYDKNNKIGRYDVFVKETSSFYMGYTEENDYYNVIQTCTRLQQQAVDNNMFDLPQLPQAPFTTASITVPPKFRPAGGFVKYLSLNLDANTGSRYLKLEKGESSTRQTVMVLFMINEKGQVSNVQVVNKGEVHPRLADEAVRVISASPLWVPATVLGEKTIFWYKQPVTFEVSKK